jgi:hypothetical protein
MDEHPVQVRRRTLLGRLFRIPAMCRAILLPAVLGAVLAWSGVVAAATPLVPFHAEYAVARNGSDLGVSTLDLRADDDGTWSLESHTRGTHGLASLAGVDVVETSHFRWHDGRPESLGYSLHQQAAFKDHRRTIEFDHDRGEATVTDDGKQHRYPIAPAVIDRHLASLALAVDLMHGVAELSYPVAVKDRVEPNHYRRTGHETIEVPAGRYDAVRVDRDDPGRKASSWFAPSLDWLPVRIEQTDRKGNQVVLKLTRTTARAR